jgi:hypothetical protein
VIKALCGVLMFAVCCLCLWLLVFFVFSRFVRHEWSQEGLWVSAGFHLFTKEKTSLLLKEWLLDSYAKFPESWARLCAACMTIITTDSRSLADSCEVTETVDLE